MSGIVGSKFNHRGSGLVGSLGTDGQHMLSAGAGKTNVFETVAGGGGKVAQVVHVAVTAITSDSTADSWEDISGFTAAITPTADDSKILVLIDFTGGANRQSGWRVVRATDTTLTDGIGDEAGSRIRSTKGTLFTGYTNTQTRFSSTVILDEPATDSEVTYKLQWHKENEYDYLFLNKCSVATDTDDNASHRARSGITLMEITA